MLDYRETHLPANFGWVDFDDGSAGADGKLAELAEQLGKMVEHPKSKSAQPRFARRWVPLYTIVHPPLRDILMNVFWAITLAGGPIL